MLPLRRVLVDGFRANFTMGTGICVWLELLSMTSCETSCGCAVTHGQRETAERRKSKNTITVVEVALETALWGCRCHFLRGTTGKFKG